MAKRLTLMPGMSLMLVEGKDAFLFCIWACKAYQLEHIQVLDFGGITELTSYLSMLRQLPGFGAVPAILIVRDAETDADGALQSIRDSLRKTGFDVPEKPNKFSGEKLQVGYELFPGTMSAGKYDNGTLEDLCLKTVEHDPLFRMSDEYIAKVNRRQPLSHLHKSRIHAYLAGKNRFVGDKLGEAARDGAWDWHHPVMAGLHEAMRMIDKSAMEKRREAKIVKGEEK